MKYAKVSVTLEQEVLAELRRTVGRRGLSAFVNEAVRQGRAHELSGAVKGGASCWKVE